MSISRVKGLTYGATDHMASRQCDVTLSSQYNDHKLQSTTTRLSGKDIRAHFFMHYKKAGDNGTKSFSLQSSYLIDKRTVPSDVKCITQHFRGIIVFSAVCTLHISHPPNNGSVYLHQLRHTFSFSTISSFRNWTSLDRSANFPPIHTPTTYFCNTILLMLPNGPFPSRLPSTILYGLTFRRITSTIVDVPHC